MMTQTQPMPMTDNSTLDKLAESFLGRLALTVLFVAVAALAIPFLFYNNSVLLPVVLRWASLAWLGLVSGLAVRGIFNNINPLGRLLCAWSVLLIGLWLAHRLTSGYVGTGISLDHTVKPGWESILQVLFSDLIAGLALFAQRKPRVRVKPRSLNLSKGSAGQKPQARVTSPQQPADKKTKAVKLENPESISANLPHPLPWQPRLKNLGEGMRMWRRRAGQMASNSRQKAASLLERSRQGLRLRLNPSRRKVSFPSPRLKVPAKPSAASMVHLVGEEEHRCPYCLDLVDPQDPRGVKICPECRTYHHADCWAVTGACQVPHHHA